MIPSQLFPSSAQSTIKKTKKNLVQTQSTQESYIGKNGQVIFGKKRGPKPKVGPALSTFDGMAP